ncbi:membrane transporter [Oryctes borbonicus]|uniref:Membrane transporter n=1 Tax=Oryctes borbonicus TaxID=1629725 RepID=A0A0T6AUA6_9SCAR|nr:membrane transporter [Oryctes borbonicus]
MFYYSMFVIIFQFGWASVQISHLSLIPELTPNEHDRTKLTAIRYCFTVFSNLLVYVITWWVLHIGTGSGSQIGPDDAPKFQYVVWSGMSVGILCSLIFHILVKEGYSGNDVRGGELRMGVRELMCRIEIYQVAVVYMSTRLFVNLSQVFIPLYLHETLNMAASALALVPLVMFIGSFVTAMSIEALNRGFGRRVNLYREKNFIYKHIYFTNFKGSGGSIILVTSLGITADLIGDKTGSGAFVYGVMSFCDKIANGIAVMVIQNLHVASQTNYYRDVITYVCGGSAILGSLAVMSLVKRIREGRHGYEPIPEYNSINSESTATQEISPTLIS